MVMVNLFTITIYHKINLLHRCVCQTRYIHTKISLQYGTRGLLRGDIDNQYKTRYMDRWVSKDWTGLGSSSSTWELVSDAQ